MKPPVWTFRSSGNIPTLAHIWWSPPRVRSVLRHKSLPVRFRFPWMIWCRTNYLDERASGSMWASETKPGLDTPVYSVLSFANCRGAICFGGHLGPDGDVEALFFQTTTTLYTSRKKDAFGIYELRIGESPFTLREYFLETGYWTLVEP
jgi:hypothetical protein